MHMYITSGPLYVLQLTNVEPVVHALWAGKISQIQRLSYYQVTLVHSNTASVSQKMVRIARMSDC